MLQEAVDPTVPLYEQMLFRQNILMMISPVFLSDNMKPQFLHNRALYLVVQLRRKDAEVKKESEQYALVEIPSSLTRIQQTIDPL